MTTLVDAGPLVALLDQRDAQHKLCVSAAGSITDALVSTWPAFTEAMYVLGDRAGWGGQARLWELVRRDALRLVDLDAAQCSRCRILMEKYADLPMDLADASLVAFAEAYQPLRLFTLDSHFRIYRLHGRRSIDTIP